jgi:radical SAM superfamily enzyme YgiQ (UPF0313 family)
LAACLRAHRFVDVVPLDIDLANEPDAATIVEHVVQLARGCRPSEVDVAIGVFIWNDHLVKSVIRQLRARGFRGRIILGGPQISYADRGLELAFPEADIFVRGYGEGVLAQIATDPAADPPGVHVAGTPDCGGAAALDASSLASPWLTGEVPVRSDDGSARALHWETKRGCPFACGFCQHRGALANRRVFELPFDRLRAEISLFVDTRVPELSIIDPVFNVGSAYLLVLSDLRRQGFGGLLSLQCRGELIDETFLDAAEGLRVLPEVGVQTIHEPECRAVNRTNRLCLLERAFELLRARGITFMVTLIYGLPGQSLTTFVQSVRWCLDQRVPIVRAFPLMLLPGTALHTRREEWGLATEGHDSHKAGRESLGRASGGCSLPLVVESSTFSRDDWSQMERVSSVLQRTEGRHPSTIREVLALADLAVPGASQRRAPVLARRAA